jgi:predicted lipase
MRDHVSAFVAQVKQTFELRSPHRVRRALVFEYALIAAILGLNPFPHFFSFSLILLGILNIKLMRDIGRKWGYPKGQDILAIAGNLFGGLGALLMAGLAWGTLIVAAIYFPVLATFALAAGYATFTWIVGQATDHFYATGKSTEARDPNVSATPVGLASQMAGGGGSVQRRNVLLGLLAAGTSVTGLTTYFRQQQFQQEQAKLARLALSSDAFVEQYLTQALTGDTQSSQAVQELKDGLKLVAPQVPYDRQLSKMLIRCTRLGTEQYITGTIVPEYDGSIKRLPSYEPRFAKYTQVATLTGPEEATTSRQIKVPTDEQITTAWRRDALRENLDQIEDLVSRVGGQAVTVKWLNPVYWGFVLQSPENSVIAFRGTQQTNEWVQNVWIQQIRHSPLSPFEFEGQVHRGFATLYTPIAKQVLEAAQKLDKSRPLYITGHSLGASLATLAAMDLAIQIPELRDQLRLYTYAGPRVGNIEFAEAHSRFVPNHYRVVNMADSFPSAPPTMTGRLVFAHAGQTWTFVDYFGDIVLGHFVSVYRKAIDAEQEQLLDRRT